MDRQRRSFGHRLGRGGKAESVSVAGKRKKEDIRTRFGRRVRKLRKERGWSQEMLAEECGLDRTYISGIERGTRNVSLVNIRLLAETFGISISTLFQGLDV
jgi:ribosome-binding protein aMBF1 (putative translation factor)